MQESHEVFER